MSLHAFGRSVDVHIQRFSGKILLLLQDFVFVMHVALINKYYCTIILIPT
jgi:hypothetical protein